MSARVTYGGWERDPDVLPIMRPNVIDDQPVLQYTYRRKRFETWWENGQKMGRWTWERQA